jgi:agmatine deiminase
VAAVQWQFNSWGGKYPPWDLDNAAGSAVARALNVPEFPTDSVLEGGSIDGNGHGALLTTRSCLLDPHRNADASQATLERLVREYLRVSEVIWIPGGPLAGDDTDGHVDQLARFVSEHQVVVALAEDRADANFEPLQRNFVALRDYGRRRSPELEIIPLPMPRPLYTDGQRVPASYCNFYVANGCVLVPAFDDPHDQRALAILADLFPDRDVIAMASRELVWGLGALHCMTQQQPATA